MVKIDSLYNIYYSPPFDIFLQYQVVLYKHNTNPKEENDYDTELLCKYFSDEFINKV